MKGNSSALVIPTSAPPTTRPIDSFLITFHIQTLFPSVGVPHPGYLALPGTGSPSGACPFESEGRRDTIMAKLTTTKKMTEIQVMHQAEYDSIGVKDSAVKSGKKL